MRTLALEFSSERRSVAIAEDDRVLASVSEHGGRETRAFQLIQSALEQARVSRASIEVLVIGLGPGSYTGVRAAIAIAQGWQLADGVRLLGISSVACLGAQLAEGGFAGPAGIVIDAQRGEFYLTMHGPGAGGIRELEPLRIVNRACVEQLAATGLAIVGPDAAPFGGGRLMWPEAATLARLAAGRRDYVAGEMLEPIYLRPVSFVKAPLARRKLD